MLRDTFVGPGAQFRQDNGLLLFYDTFRLKWISAARENVTFGIDHRNVSNDRWMSLISSTYSNVVGYRIPRNATITAVTVQTQNLATCSFRIRKNNSPVNITTISLAAEAGKSNDDLDIDLTENDFLQCYLEAITGDVDFPTLLLELAWRE